MAGSDPIHDRDVVRISIYGVAGSSVFENVLHYRCQGEPTDIGIIGQLQSMLGVFDDLFLDIYKTILCDTVKITGAKIRRVSGDGSPVVQVGYDIAGTLPQLQAATATAACFRKFTAVAGKKGIGMFYVPALAETLQAGDFVDTGNALFTTIATLLVTHLVLLPDTEFIPVLFKAGEAGAPDRDVVYASVNATVSTQDRRRPRL